MNKYQFEALKKEYSTVTEAIKLYDSGKHSEYNKDLLDEQLDKIHEEICDAASEIAQYLIDKIDEKGDRAKVKMTNRDWANIKYLNSLGYMACKCRDHCESPEEYLGLTKSYGNGYIDSIGADFYVWSCRKQEYTRYGYKEFYQLLDEYGLIID